MVDDTGVAQAREMLAALREQIEDISRKLEVIENRAPRASVRGAAQDQKHRNELRQDLYDAHRYIDGIHRRFPATRPARRNWPSNHLAVDNRRSDHGAVQPQT
jgi:hypothetical protein